MLLNWENGECANPPNAYVGAWQLCVYSVAACEWAYAATRRADAPARHIVRQNVANDGYPTARVAALACEAALLRLGVVPLPGWYKVLCEGEWIGAMRLDVGNHAWANVCPVDEGEGYEWSVYTTNPRLSPCGAVEWTIEAGQVAAERHLRAALAAWLDAEAALEAK